MFYPYKFYVIWYSLWLSCAEIRTSNIPFMSLINTLYILQPQFTSSMFVITFKITMDVCLSTEGHIKHYSNRVSRLKSQNILCVYVPATIWPSVRP